MISFDGSPIDAEPGDSVLVALARAGVHPTGGGVLCATGDCANCVVEIGGTAYQRACQTQAAAGLDVRSHPSDGPPALPSRSTSDVAVAVRNVHADVAVVGQGPSGTVAANDAAATGASVVTFDTRRGEEVVGVFPGPLVVTRTPDGMTHAHVDRVVVAAGSAAVVPVCAGSHLAGVLTPTAAAAFGDAGVDLGRVVEIDEQPARILGTDRVTGVELADGTIRECDTLVVDLGRVPRDQLARMGADLDVEVVGSAATPGVIPTCPAEGVVCPCNGTTVEDLHTAWGRGFTQMELLKRASLAGTGTCQGAMCVPYLRGFLTEHGGVVPDAFTARPVARQATLDELAAGRQFPAVPRTALDAEHRSLGATMDRLGGWWRPWTYGDTDAECQAVRSAVSVGDVSTLGKFIVAGPDAEAALQRLFPTDVATIRPGRARYVLLLDERGHVLDDGMILREEAGDRFYVTVTSSGATVAEMWFQDWTADLDVRWMNVTMSLGAINVTGPSAAELLANVGFTDSLTMLGHRRAEIAGVDCRVVRLSFTGEASYELHHPWHRSVELWQRLLEEGAGLGVRPHGLEALTRLRLEKGHVIVGQDTDYDSTPRRLDHDWAVNLDKGDFVGRSAVVRTNKIPLDKQLVGLTVDGPPPFEGALLRHLDDGDYAGYVTSSAWSASVGSSVLLAWMFLRDGELAGEVEVEGATARRVSLPFYDPEGVRVRA